MEVAVKGAAAATGRGVLIGVGMLAAAYAATRTLWLPIGLHFGWNFAAAGIFGTEVSGNGTPQGLLDGVTSGPALLTGGAFGPEASPYTVVFGVLLTIAFIWLARRRGWFRCGAAPGPARPLRSPSDRTPAGPGPVAAVEQLDEPIELFRPTGCRGRGRVRRRCRRPYV
ncbi:hypothetical protein [Nonomuraea sp. 10N515B]|uniref:hypothetical protein n=1 Tax=Nonomuraea sp. 10N515B TaxID=3457422 RepID=UPI003FCDFDFA